jgi:probable rRNA maturation factor
VSTGGGSVEVLVEGIPSPAWRRRLPRFCARVLSAFGAERWEVAVLLCGDERITDLNARFRGKQRPTDVLSFPRGVSANDTSVDGDIALSLDALKRNAERYGVAEDEELKRLVVHGLLHLAGFDHGRGKGRKMLALQESLLDRMGSEAIMARTGRGSS